MQKSSTNTNELIQQYIKKNDRITPRVTHPNKVWPIKYSQINQ